MWPGRQIGVRERDPLFKRVRVPRCHHEPCEPRPATRQTCQADSGARLMLGMGTKSNRAANGLKVQRVATQMLESCAHCGDGGRDGVTDFKRELK